MTMFGEVDTYCFIDFSSGGTLNISNRISNSTPFEIDCNQPLTISIWSSSGGLVLDDKFQQQPNEYFLHLLVSSIGINKTFSSKDISSVQRVTGNNDIPFNAKGSIRIIMEEDFVFSGEYKDVITIDVSPSINGGIY
ncbi:hypothetical protein LRP50_15550 [Enterovibrio sp. ZSDZ42]|uniref:Uncharacterized protein n=1 Tax=Enterovibrio gelatinilyticus TaxID=2899819 RepID=A0ABT5R4W0_9GAMM|nr:hypothetical protein [Enterovibrio sp. ZSDZ42]MDD1794547.1 hypothetical protein [Enterovibrio sp. ZSDZ42]